MLLEFTDTKYVCPVLYKCGYSTLGYVYFYKKAGRLLKKYEDTDDAIMQYYNPRTIDLYNDYKVFFVWRDPYERLVSLYKDTASGSMHHAGLVKEMGYPRKELLNDIGLFVQAALDVARAKRDNHVKKQADVLRDEHITLDRVDVIVDIKDLQPFIYNDLQFTEAKVMRNISRKDIDVSGFEEYRQQIVSFYQEDYDIRTNYSQKFYIPQAYTEPKSMDPRSVVGADYLFEDKLYKIYKRIKHKFCR